MATLNKLVEGKNVSVIELTVVKILAGVKALVAETKTSAALLLTHNPVISSLLSSIIVYIALIITESSSNIFLEFYSLLSNMFYMV